MVINFLNKLLIGTLLILLSVLIPFRASSSAPVDWNDYHNNDYFRWTNYDDDVHLLGAYSLSLTTGIILVHYFHVNKWEAALISAAAVGAAGTFKEVFVDTYNSKTDIKMFYVGGISGGISVILLEF